MIDGSEAPPLSSTPPSAQDTRPHFESSRSPFGLVPHITILINEREALNTSEELESIGSDVDQCESSSPSPSAAEHPHANGNTPYLVAGNSSAPHREPSLQSSASSSDELSPPRSYQFNGCSSFSFRIDNSESTWDQVKMTLHINGLTLVGLLAASQKQQNGNREEQ